jgi:hypothetical protein
MKVLIACEFSGRVREAFAKRGHDAWSCDLLPTEIPGQHLQGDVLQILKAGWDLMVAFPPCTHLANSGARWWKNKAVEQRAAADFFMALAQAPIPRIAIENPIGIMSTLWRKPDQIVQPWWFGDEATKSTCLWLKNLPRLVPTNAVSPGNFYVTPKGKRMPAWYNLPQTKNRSKLRSITFPGLADAMAEQWSGPFEESPST